MDKGEFDMTQKRRASGRPRIKPFGPSPKPKPKGRPKGSSSSSHRGPGAL